MYSVHVPKLTRLARRYWGAIFCFFVFLKTDPFLSIQQSLKETSAATPSSKTVESPPILDLSLQKAESYHAQAIHLQSQGNEAGAEGEFKAAWMEAPKEPKYVRGITNFFIQRSRYDEAIAVIANQVKLCGETALGYELEGELLFHQKHYEMAFEALKRSLALYNHNARAHQLLGLVWLIRRQNLEALGELQTAAEQDPDQPQIRYFLGRVYYSTANYPAARDEFLACLKFQPGFPKALENLALSYEALNEDDKAIQVFQEAISLEGTRPGPRRVEALVYYAVLRAKMGQLEEAFGMLRQAIGLSPKSFRANFELGRLLLKSGRLAEAERHLLAAAELDSKFSRTYYFLARLNKEQKRTQEADRYMALFQHLDKDVRNREFSLTDR